MRKPVFILHIDSEYQPHYLSIQKGLFIHSRLSMKEAVTLLKKMDFDLIISEPHQKALLLTEGERE